MFKKLLAIMLALFAAAVFAASADVNKASQAELEAVKGIGPGIATKLSEQGRIAELTGHDHAWQKDDVRKHAAIVTGQR